MGFSLVSAMGLYWFVGAIFSIVQTLVIQIISERKAARK
jgi:membrane protein insertase Oxa1/YidC/SpoIIIJ